MSTILITGSNRGLGLEWARQYAEKGWEVIATCRFPEAADALSALSQSYPNLVVRKLDVTRPEHIDSLRHAMQGKPLDLLINNAGVYFERWGRDRLGTIDFADWQTTFAVNTLGAMRLSEALIDNIAASEHKLIVAITSHMGSLADINSPNDYAYRSSKAALNAAMKGLSHEVRELDVGVLLLHPGWVKTRMGGGSAPYTAEQSVQGMRRLIGRFDLSRSGQFYRFDGEPMPW